MGYFGGACYKYNSAYIRYNQPKLYSSHARRSKNKIQKKEKDMRIQKSGPSSAKI